MSLPPLACWESKVAGQEYQIRWFDFYGKVVRFPRPRSQYY